MGFALSLGGYELGHVLGFFERVAQPFHPLTPQGGGWATFFEGVTI